MRVVCIRVIAIQVLTISLQAMYNAIRLFGALVDYQGDYKWDFSNALNMVIPPIYCELVYDYLEVFNGKEVYAWKLPESILALPWLVKMFPDAYYIHWVRDGRDNILSWHGTDDDWYGVEIQLPQDRLKRAAMSWSYHMQLVEATEKPRNWLDVRLEDMVNNRFKTTAIIEDYLDMKLSSIDIRGDVVGRWVNHDIDEYIPIMQPYLEEYSYDLLRVSVEYYAT
jgi:hypothetical protein